MVFLCIKKRVIKINSRYTIVTVQQALCTIFLFQVQTLFYQNCKNIGKSHAYQANFDKSPIKFFAGGKSKHR